MRLSTVAALAALVASLPALAVNIEDSRSTGGLAATGTCPATGGAVYVDTEASSTVGVDISGTFVGTIQWRGTIDGTALITLSAFPTGSTTPVTSATSTGTWVIQSGGMKWVCAYFSAYTSGTATVSLNATLAQGAVQGSGAPVVITGGALTANQSVNVAQINGVTTLMGNGATGTGSQRVTVASDNTPFPVKIDQTTPGTTNKVVSTPAVSSTIGTQRVCDAGNVSPCIITTTAENVLAANASRKACSVCAAGAADIVCKRTTAAGSAASATDYEYLLNAGSAAQKTGGCYLCHDAGAVWTGPLNCYALQASAVVNLTVSETE